jgi:hypothetical protein
MFELSVKKYRDVNINADNHFALIEQMGMDRK